MKKIISIDELSYYNDNLWLVINHKIEETKDNIISIVPSIEYCTKVVLIREHNLVHLHHILTVHAL